MKKITVNTRQLREALDKALSCVKPDSSYLPISDFMIFCAAEEGNYIRLTDLKCHLRLPLAFKADTFGEMVIQYIELKKYLKLLPDGELVITKVANKDLVHVMAGGDLVKLPVEAPENYPPLKPIAGGNSITVDRQLLKTEIDKAVKFVDSDKYRVSNNLLLSTEDGDLSVYATDGYIAYKSIIPCTGTLGRFAFSTDIQNMLDIAGGDQVTVSVDHYKFQIEANGAVMIGALFSEQYPRVERFFDRMPEKAFKIRKGAIDTVLRRAGIFGDTASKKVILDFDRELTVTSAAEGINIGFETCLNFESDEPITMRIGFNSVALHKAVMVHDEEELKVFYTTPQEAFYVRKGKDTSLVMPMVLDIEREQADIPAEDLNTV